MSYFEIWFSSESTGGVSPPETVCIKATREPTVSEASVFCRAEEELLKKKVTNVTPLTKEEAANRFDLSNEAAWPVFGKEKNKMLLIGEYIPATENQTDIIHRAPYGEGLVFKDEDAFLNHMDKPCYIPELSDSVYTHRDLLSLFNGQEEFAKVCFYELDWEHPETWCDDAIRHEELAMCPHCEKLYWMEGEICACPVCGSMPEN